MSKNSGINVLKKMKKKINKSDSGVKAQKVSMRDNRAKSQRQNPLDVGLSVTSKRADKKRSMAQPDAPRKSERAAAVEQSRSISRRYRRKNGSFLTSLRSISASLFGLRTSDNAALDFAANLKRRSKRDKRKRMLMFGGIGAVVVIVLLVVVLVPNGAAAPAGSDAQSSAGLNAVAMQTDTPGITGLGAKMPVLMPFTPSSAMDSDDIDDDSDAEIGVPNSDVVEPEVMEEPEPEQTPEATPVPTTKPEPTPPPVKVDDLIDFFIVEADAYYNKMGYSSNTYKYSDEEFLMLARIIDGEARGESFKGKVAVGNVIMNRVLSRAWPNDIISVVSAPGQFSVYSRVKDSSPSSSAKRAARAVLDFETWEVPQDVYFFRSSGSEGADWGRNKYYGRIGGHFFYTYGYSGRHRGGGVPPALFNRTYQYAQYGCKPEKRVYRIQYMLNKLGYDVKADRYFGKGTKDALIEFQSKNGLEADGVAGPVTVKKLIESFGVQNYYERFVK